MKRLFFFSLQNKIAQNRYWPVEIVRTPIQQATKTKGKQGLVEEDVLISYHGVAYVNMAPLLYPGVRRCVLEVLFPKQVRVFPKRGVSKQEKTGERCFCNIAGKVTQFQPSDLLTSSACSLMLWTRVNDAMKPLTAMSVSSQWVWKD